jgi:hypothetical protein
LRWSADISGDTAAEGKSPAALAVGTKEYTIINELEKINSAEHLIVATEEKIMQEVYGMRTRVDAMADDISQIKEMLTSRSSRNV